MHLGLNGNTCRCSLLGEYSRQNTIHGVDWLNKTCFGRLSTTETLCTFTNFHLIKFTEYVFGFIDGYDGIKYIISLGINTQERNGSSK